MPAYSCHSGDPNPSDSMPTNKVEFEMSIKEISFKFKGDYELGQKLQKGISDAVDGIAKLQNSAMSIEDASAKPVTGSVVELFRTKRRTRKRPAGAAEGTGESNPENGETTQAAGATRGGTGTSPTKLMLELRKSGFFSVKRKAAEVQAELNTKGHTRIGPQDLTSPLISLCKKDVLKRSKNESDVWVYENGSNDG